MMIAPLGWYFLVHGNGTTRRLFGVAVTVASFLGIFASGSRGAYMGLFAAFLGFVFLWIVRNARQHPGDIVTAFASVVGAWAAVVIVRLSSSPGDCMQPSSAAAPWTRRALTRVGRNGRI